MHVLSLDCPGLSRLLHDFHGCFYMISADFFCWYTLFHTGDIDFDLLLSSSWTSATHPAILAAFATDTRVNVFAMVRVWVPARRRVITLDLLPGLCFDWGSLLPPLQLTPAFSLSNWPWAANAFRAFDTHYISTPVNSLRCLRSHHRLLSPWTPSKHCGVHAWRPLLLKLIRQWLNVYSVFSDSWQAYYWCSSALHDRPLRRDGGLTFRCVRLLKTVLVGVILRYFGKWYCPSGSCLWFFKCYPPRVDRSFFKNENFSLLTFGTASLW